MEVRLDMSYMQRLERRKQIETVTNVHHRQKQPKKSEGQESRLKELKHICAGKPIWAILYKTTRSKDTQKIHASSSSLLYTLMYNPLRPCEGMNNYNKNPLPS